LRFDVWLQSVESAWQIDTAIGREASRTSQRGSDSARLVNFRGISLQVRSGGECRKSQLPIVGSSPPRRKLRISILGTDPRETIATARESVNLRALGGDGDKCGDW
jgi:hypothetical protein